MKEIRATFYELRGYFVPGSILLWMIAELLALTGYAPTTLAISTLRPVVQGVLFIIIAYVSGHALHAIANYTIDKLPFASYPPKTYFEGQFQKDFSPEAIDSLLRACASLIGTQNANAKSSAEIIKRAYWMCFQFVMCHQNVETESFLGLSGFYRGMTSALLVATIFYAIAFIRLGNREIGIICLVVFLLSMLFLTRVKRFGNYLTRTVYSNFLHLYKGKTTGGADGEGS